MLAIIIVAMISTLIAFGSYVLYGITLLEKRERNFYDIIALFYFFRKLEVLGNWNEFWKNTETMTVRRRLASEEAVKNEDVILLGTDYGKICCYEFSNDELMIPIYLALPRLHYKKSKSMFQNCFQCKVDERRQKVHCYGSFKRSIFVISFSTAFQTLFFALEEEETAFRECYGKYIECSKQINEITKWIEHQKDLITQPY